MNKLKNLGSILFALIFGFMISASLVSCNSGQQSDQATEETDAATEADSTAAGEHPEGEHPEGEHPEGEDHEEGEHPEGEHPEGEHPDSDDSGEQEDGGEAQQ